MAATQISELVLKSLQKAREVLNDPARWVKCHYCLELPANPCYCLAGALNLSPGSYRYGREVETRVLVSVDALGFKRYDPVDKKDHSYRCIEQFNDDPKRTHEQIIQVLDHAIKAVGAAYVDKAAA